MTRRSAQSSALAADLGHLTGVQAEAELATTDPVAPVAQAEQTRQQRVLPSMLGPRRESVAPVALVDTPQQRQTVGPEEAFTPEAAAVAEAAVNRPDRETRRTPEHLPPRILAAEAAVVVVGMATTIPAPERRLAEALAALADQVSSTF